MHKNWISKGLIVLFIPIQFWFFYIIFHYPYNGLNVKEIDGHWFVAEIDPKSQTWGSGLHVGDEILQVDGLNPDRYPTVIKWGSVEQASALFVTRNGSVFDFNLSNPSTLTSQDIYYIIGEIISLAVSGILYYGMNRSKSARYLALVFFNIGATCMSIGASIRGDSLGKSILSISLMLVPIAMLHFLIVFFQEKANIKLPSRFLKYVYLFISSFLLTQLTFFFPTKYASFTYNHLSILILPVFSFGVIMVISYLIYVFYKHRKVSPHISSMVKSVGVSFAISVAPVISLSFLPQIFIGSGWVDPRYTSWIVALFPLSFTYLLAAKKIYDIDLVVRRFLLSTLLSILPAVIVVAMILTLFTSKAKTDHLVIAFIVTVVLFSIMLYSLEYLTVRLEKFVFPRRHYLQTALRKIAKKLGMIANMRELKDLILVDIVEVMQVSGGALVNQSADNTEIMTDGEIDENEALRAVMGESDPSTGYTCYEIARNEEYVSTLVLTPKKSNTLFGTEETQWLNVIISYLTVSMENLYLIRKMTTRLEHLASRIPNEHASEEFAWFRKLMFDLQEQERSRIATDLHDTTMQDLFFLKRKLVSLFDKYTLSKEDATRFEGLLEYIDVINMNLRQSCFELHPHLLQEVGLVGAVEKLLDLEKATAPFHIEFWASGAETIEACGMETKRHLFRVVQELLNNAKKHSEARFVRFRLKASPEGIMLSYEDDGVGFDGERSAVLEIGRPHIGMEQMKSRILSMDGKFELIAGAGKGMKFTASLPFKEGRTA